MRYKTMELIYTPLDAEGNPVTPEATPELRVTVRGEPVQTTVSSVGGSYRARVTPETGRAHEWEWSATFANDTQDVMRGRFTPQPE